MDRAPPVFKNNVQVFYLILDKKRASSHVIRKQEDPISKTRDRPFQLHEKERAPFTAQSARRDLLSLWVRDVHEKEESSVYPSVGEKRPPFSLGKGKRSCLSPLPLEKMKRACAKEERVEFPVGTTGPPVSLSEGRELLTILLLLFKTWQRAYDQKKRMEVLQTSNLDKRSLVLRAASEGKEKFSTRYSEARRKLTPSYSWQEKTISF